MESIKSRGSYCIILTAQHFTDAFIQSDTEPVDYSRERGCVEQEGSSCGTAEEALSGHEEIKYSSSTHIPSHFD